MKKLIALIAVISFITVKSVSAQTAAQENVVKQATEMKSENAEAKHEMKSCHGNASKSCCMDKKKSKASCCAKHGEEKAEAVEKKDDKMKSNKD